MVIDRKNIENIQNYIDYLESKKKQFYNELVMINDNISKRISYNICDGIYELRNCVVPNDRDIQDKVKDELEKISETYYDETYIYINCQMDYIFKHTEAIDKDNIEIDIDELVASLNNPVSYIDEEQIKEQQRQIENNIVTRVTTHVGLRNVYNDQYYTKTNSVENIVKEEVRKYIPTFIKEINELNDTINTNLIDNKNDFLDYMYSLVEEKNKKEISENERAFIDDNKRLEPILDVQEKNISNNERAFVGDKEELKPILDIEDKEYHTQELDKEAIRKRMQELRESLVGEQEESENAKAFK